MRNMTSPRYASIDATRAVGGVAMVSVMPGLYSLRSRLGTRYPDAEGGVAGDGGGEAGADARDGGQGGRATPGDERFDRLVKSQHRFGRPAERAHPVQVLPRPGQFVG